MTNQSPIATALDVTWYLRIRQGIRIFPHILASMTVLMVLALLFMPAVGTNIYTAQEMLINWLSSLAFSLMLLWIVYLLYRDSVVSALILLSVVGFMAITTLQDPQDNGSYVLWFLLMATGCLYLVTLLYFRQHKVYRYLSRHKRASPLLRARRLGLLLPRSMRHCLIFSLKTLGALIFYFLLVSLVIMGLTMLVDIEVPVSMHPIFWFFSLLITQGKAIRPAFGWFHHTQRKITPSASELAVVDARLPVLFLRSFKTDEIVIKGRFRPFLFFFGGKRGQTERLEEVLATEVFSEGPVIAVANPADSLPPLGAARENLADDSWRTYVTDYIARSQLILGLVGDTQHFGWELDQICAKHQRNKTLLVIPPADLNSLHLRNLNRFFRTDSTNAESTLTEWLPQRTRAMVYSSQHRGFVAICSKQSTGLAYVEALRLALGLRSCHGTQIGI